MAGIFDQGGGKTAKFDNQGDRLQGVVESFKVSQQNKFDSVNWKPTNDPDFWPSGDPKMQVVIAVDTTKGPAPQRESDEDDGVRNLYATITSGEGTMFRAIQDAIKAAHGGVKADIEQGAFLDVWFSGYDPNSKNKANPKKVYGAAYRRPAGPFAAGGAPDQGQQQQPQGFQPAGQVAPAQSYGAPAGFNPNQGMQAPAPQGYQQGGYVQPGAPAGPPPQQPQYAGGSMQPPAQVDPWTGQPAQQAPVQQHQYPDPQQAAPAQNFGQQPQYQGGPQQVPGQQGVDFAAIQQQNYPDQGQQPGPYQQGAPAGGDPFAGDPNRAQQVAQAQAHFPNAPQQQSAPPAQAAPAPQAVQVDMQRVQALIAAQMDDATIMQATGCTQEALNVARNLGAVPAGMPQ